MGAADEDSLTGALGQAMAMPGEHFFDYGGNRASVKIGYMKLRGRGPNAPEKSFGSDGIFQIEVLDHSGNSLFMKGLAFQAKNNWTYKLSQLADQAALMEQHTPGGIVIDFRASGYGACLASIAKEAQGRRPVDMRDLGDLLATDFLNCTLGTPNLWFNNGRRQFEKRSTNLHIITTTVKL